MNQMKKQVKYLIILVNMARYLHTAIEYDGKFVKSIVTHDGKPDHTLSHCGSVRDILSDSSSKLLSNTIHPSVPNDVDPELFDYIKDEYFRDIFTLSLKELTEEDFVNRTKWNTFHASFDELQVIETRLKERLDDTIKRCIEIARHDDIGQRLSNIESHLGIKKEENDSFEYDDFEYILEDVDDLIWDFRNFSSYTQEILDYVTYNLNMPYPKWSKIRVTFFIL